MPYSKDKTIPAIAGKSDKVKEVFAEAANSALSKGQDEQSAIFAGLAAVKNYEKKTTVAKAILPPKLIPSHLQAIIDIKNNKKILEQSNKIELEKKAVASAKQEDNTVSRVYVDEYGRVVTEYKSGRKETSKPISSQSGAIISPVIVNQVSEGSSNIRRIPFAAGATSLVIDDVVNTPIVKAFSITNTIGDTQQVVDTVHGAALFGESTMSSEIIEQGSAIEVQTEISISSQYYPSQSRLIVNLPGTIDGVLVVSY